MVSIDGFRIFHRDVRHCRLAGRRSLRSRSTPRIPVPVDRVPKRRVWKGGRSKGMRAMCSAGEERGLPELAGDTVRLELREGGSRRRRIAGPLLLLLLPAMGVRRRRARASTGTPPQPCSSLRFFGTPALVGCCATFRRTTASGGASIFLACSDRSKGIRWIRHPAPTSDNARCLESALSLDDRSVPQNSPRPYHSLYFPPSQIPFLVLRRTKNNTLSGRGRLVNRTVLDR